MPKEKDPEEDKNPVVRTHHGVQIRRVNRLHMHFNEYEYMKLINTWAAMDKKISISQIIALQGMPCQLCGHSNVCIPKGVLSVNKDKTEHGE
jgi:ATP-dependent helicase/DNAse subunit B